jgi:hypothetical protein
VDGAAVGGRRAGQADGLAARGEPLVLSRDVSAGQCDYVSNMTRTDAQKELERIERELNAKAAPPAEESRIARVNRKQPHLDAVLIGVVALLTAFVPSSNHQVIE